MRQKTIGKIEEFLGKSTASHRTIKENKSRCVNTVRRLKLRISCEHFAVWSKKNLIFRGKTIRKNCQFYYFNIFLLVLIRPKTCTPRRQHITIIFRDFLGSAFPHPKPWKNSLTLENRTKYWIDTKIDIHPLSIFPTPSGN